MMSGRSFLFIRMSQHNRHTQLGQPRSCTLRADAGKLWRLPRPEDVERWFRGVGPDVFVLDGYAISNGKINLRSDEAEARTGFVDGGSAIKRHGDDKAFYDKLYFKKSDLRRRIKELKKLG